MPGFEASSYLPLIVLMVAIAGIAYVIWRGHYGVGAYIVQLVFAAFVSSLGAYLFYVITIVMFVPAVLPGSVTGTQIAVVISMAIGSTIGFVVVKRYGTSEETVTVREVAGALAISIVGGTIGYITFRDVGFGADFWQNASSVGGTYLGALIGANLLLVIGGAKRVLRRQEP